MEFPRLVYKDGGTEQRPGGAYSHMCVKNEADYLAALASGWHPSLEDAIAPTMPVPILVGGVGGADCQESLMDDELLGLLGSDGGAYLRDLTPTPQKDYPADLTHELLHGLPKNTVLLENAPVEIPPTKNTLSVKKNK